MLKENANDEGSIEYQHALWKFAKLSRDCLRPKADAFLGYTFAAFQTFQKQLSIDAQ